MSEQPTEPLFAAQLSYVEMSNLLGRGVSGELRGQVLYQLPAHNAFWFAWVTFWQDTEIYTAQ